MMSAITDKVLNSLGFTNKDKDVDKEFLKDFVLTENVLNGLEIEGFYLPEEIFIKIFSYLQPNDILICSLVCKNWFNIARSNALWQTIYNIKECPKKAKNLPWYVFYCYFATESFTNLIKNGNGENKFHHWRMVSNGGDGFIVEKQPTYCHPLPIDVPEFHGHTSCFATSFVKCSKYQEIKLKHKKLLLLILKKYKPTLYASEWFTARQDCGSLYWFRLIWEAKHQNYKPVIDYRPGHMLPDESISSQNIPDSRTIVYEVPQWSKHKWQKVEVFVDDYQRDLNTIYFQHEGRDTQFWKGHYGSKMAGGVVKFIFDSIEPMLEDMPSNIDSTN